MVIREGETLAEVKLRVQKKLQVPNEEFLKVNILNVIELSAPIIMFSILIQPSPFLECELGLTHPYKISL